MAEVTRRTQFGVPDYDLDPKFQPSEFMDATVTPAPIRRTYQRFADIAALERSSAMALAEARSQADQTAQQALWDRDLSIGPVVKPKLNSLRGYKYMLRQGSGIRGIEFSPVTYGAWDQTIAKASGEDLDGKDKHAAFNSDHPHYKDYAPLRRNLAILRNFMACHLFPDGVYDKADGTSPGGKQDQINFAAFNQMAEKLGAALADDTGFTTPKFLERWWHAAKRFAAGEKDLSVPITNEFMRAANIPDKGIAVMYNYLFDLHKTSSIYDLTGGMSPKKWPIYEREMTPFSDENLREYSRSSMTQGVADAFEENVTKQLRSVDTLTVEKKNVSVQLAREILDKLRILMSDPEEQERVSKLTDVKAEEARQLLSVAYDYKNLMAELKEIDPALLKGNKTFDETLGALEQLGYRLKVDTRAMLLEEGEPVAAGYMERRLKEEPKHLNTDIPTDQLLARLDNGLVEAGRVLERVRGQHKARAQSTEMDMHQQTVAANAAAKAARDGMDSGMMSSANIGAASKGAAEEAARRYNSHVEQESSRHKNNGRGDAPFLTPGK